MSKQSSINSVKAPTLRRGMRGRYRASNIPECSRRNSVKEDEEKSGRRSERERERKSDRERERERAHNYCVQSKNARRDASFLFFLFFFRARAATCLA